MGGALLLDKPWQGLSTISSGPEGNFLMVDESGHRVILVDPQLDTVIWKTADGLFKYPSQAAWIDPFVWVLDRFNQRIALLDSKGQWVKSIKDKELREPFSLCMSQERIFVTDTESRQIHCFDRTGLKLPQSLGKQGFSLSYFESEMFQSKAVVAKWQAETDFFRDELSQFFADGFTIGHINRPRGIFSNNACIFLADPTGMIISFSHQGEFLQEWHANRVTSSLSPAEIKRVFQGVEWLLVFQDQLYVTTSSSQWIYRIDLSNHTLTPWKFCRHIPGYITLQSGHLYVVYPYLNDLDQFSFEDI